MARYEVDYYQQESDLHDHWKECKKNPHHSEFTPVSQFNRKHLPEEFRDTVWCELIHAAKSLTVRLTTKYTSKSRPDDDDMVFAGDQDLRGTKFTRVGTGMVSKKYRWVTEKDGQACPCMECQKSPDKAKRQWGGFLVESAKHVVYDDEECRKTRCDLWFDDDGDEDKCPKLEGVEMRDSDIKKDWCEIKCITHDKRVYKKMAGMIGRYEYLRNKLNDTCRTSPAIKDEREILVVVISHPHGMSKHVTVGVRSGVERDFPCRWSYTTETCPGSSGAPVFALGKWKLPMWHGIGRHSTHSRCKQKGENQCGWNGVSCILK